MFCATLCLVSDYGTNPFYKKDQAFYIDICKTLSVRYFLLNNGQKITIFKYVNIKIIFCPAENLI